jgi:hypothetical protein
LRDLLASSGKNAPIAEEIKMIKIDNIRDFWYLSPSTPPKIYGCGARGLKGLVLTHFACLVWIFCGNTSDECFAILVVTSIDKRAAEENAQDGGTTADADPL